MTKSARVFIGLTIVSGFGVLLAAIAEDHTFPQWASFFTYCLLGLLASLLKVRLPGVTGTISANFLVILVSVAMFSLAETVVLATGACIMQSLGRTKHRPRAIQVAFNTATLALTSALTFRVSHYFAAGGGGSLVVLLAVAASFYFAMNTLLVSGVLSLVEQKSLIAVWKQCYLWSFPYYLAGAAIAGLVVFASQSMGWVTATAILPSMYLVYLFYRGLVERLQRGDLTLAATVQ